MLFYRRKRSVVCSEDNPDKLSTSITASKCEGADILEKFQPSKMETINWHMSDHLPENFQRFEVVQLLDVGICKSSHIIF